MRPLSMLKIRLWSFNKWFLGSCEMVWAMLKRHQPR